MFDRNGEHLKTIGREGEGPGEFRNANDMESEMEEASAELVEELIRQQH